MPYLASWERDAMKKGRKEGFKKGLKQGLKLAVEQGVEQGVEKGVNIERMRAAKEMLKEGFDLDVVVKITRLDRKQVEKML